MTSFAGKPHFIGCIFSQALRSASSRVSKDEATGLEMLEAVVGSKLALIDPICDQAPAEVAPTGRRVSPTSQSTKPANRFPASA
jgi:hypothetical protein